MATTFSLPTHTSNRPTYSCIRCADRKVKCDRQRPCNACVKHNVECIYNPSRPSRKRQRKVEILTDRLRHYEALLQEQGIETGRLPDVPEPISQRRSSQGAAVPSDEIQLRTPSSIDSEPSSRLSKTQVLQGQGRSKYLENGLWTRVLEEFHNPEDALDDSTDISDLEASIDDLVLDSGPRPSTQSKPHHPPPGHIHQLWHVYTERIDPLTKLLHVPTLRPAVQKAAGDIENIPRSFEALMFAIYSAAIMSLDDDECRQSFGESRRALLTRYVSATKTALSRAKFMSTINLVVLQALVLHLISVRDIYEPRATWSLTGVAVRIAHSMGLDRDGDFLELPPFESEARRRLWWLLKTHDFRTAELCGLAKFRDLDTSGESTRFPTNVNDNQLSPDMTSLVAAPSAVTDVIFIAVRHEFANFAAAKISKFRKTDKDYSKWALHPTGSNEAEIDQSTKEINETTREIEELLETKYLRYCDPSQPLHLMTMLVARAAINNIRFLSFHPRRWPSLEQTPPQERQWIWDISIKVLEQHDMGYTSPQLKQFAWHAVYFMQWHVLIHVLDTLRAYPLIAEAEKAWQLIGKTYRNRPDMISDMRKPIHVAVSILCLKSYSAREAAVERQNAVILPTPEFILQLRQQRETSKVKRQAKSNNSSGPATHPQSNAHNDPLTFAVNDVQPIDASNTYSSQQGAVPHQPDSTQPDAIIEDDPFWFVNGFDHSQINNMADVMDMDPEFMLSQDYDMEHNTNTINWQQWDAWLANSNVLPPLSPSQGFRASA